MLSQQKHPHFLLLAVGHRHADGGTYVCGVTDNIATVVEVQVVSLDIALELNSRRLLQKHNVINRQICDVTFYVRGTFIRQYHSRFYLVIGICNETVERAMGGIVFA